MESSHPKFRQARIFWLPLINGQVGIGHKPGGKISFAGLQQQGVSVVLTLLQQHEGAEIIGKAINELSMQWIWFPFSASQPPIGKKTEAVRRLFEQLQTLLNSGSKIYIHCSAGIHRTGMMAYGFLRYLGMTGEEARQHLKIMRPVTGEQVGDNRLQWGDQFAIK